MLRGEVFNWEAEMDHTIVHFEIPTDDPERAQAFYKELFGWDIRKFGGASGGEGAGGSGGDGSSAASSGGGAEGGGDGGGGHEYWMVMTVPADEEGRPTRAGVNGGMMRRAMPEQTTVNYISVEGVDEFSRKVEKLGGSVVLPRQPVPGMGWFAYVKDTEGNVFGLWECDMSAA
ncbi:MAG: VOC family protein [Gemmatimonadetes bacterium]|nr:VOC family protein [Gemmatimonadota bacterium]